MRLDPCCIDNVDYFNSTCFQEIGNQSAMTTPPNRFRAHDRSRSNSPGKSASRTDSSGGEIDKSIYAFAKLLGLHVIGVTTK